MTSTLLIDNSNTRTKLILARGEILGEEVRCLPTDSLSADAVRGILHGWSFDSAVLCSVVPAAVPVIRAALHCPVHEISPRSPGALAAQLLRFYSQPDSLGADRLANAAAAAALSPLPCIAADLGTACTFDVIARKEGAPALIGGAIAPGLSALASSLSHTTAQLPALRLPPNPGISLPSPLATTTQDAMLSGCIYGFCGMVEGILRSLAESFEIFPRIILTGGDAPLCASLHLPNVTIDNMLTFKGMLKLIP